MSYNDQLTDNITKLQRNLVGLEDAIKRTQLSKGQAAFVKIYLDVIAEHISKGLDVLDEDRYREELLNLDI